MARCSECGKLETRCGCGPNAVVFRDAQGQRHLNPEVAAGAALLILALVALLFLL